VDVRANARQGAANVRPLAQPHNVLIANLLAEGLIPRDATLHLPSSDGEDPANSRKQMRKLAKHMTQAEAQPERVCCNCAMMMYADASNVITIPGQDRSSCRAWVVFEDAVPGEGFIKAHARNQVLTRPRHNPRD
jgi:hypothetical protein